MALEARIAACRFPLCEILGGELRRRAEVVIGLVRSPFLSDIMLQREDRCGEFAAFLKRVYATKRALPAPVAALAMFHAHKQCPGVALDTCAHAKFAYTAACAACRSDFHTLYLSGGDRVRARQDESAVRRLRASLNEVHEPHRYASEALLFLHPLFCGMPDYAKVVAWYQQHGKAAAACRFTVHTPLLQHIERESAVFWNKQHAVRWALFPCTMDTSSCSAAVFSLVRHAADASAEPAESAEHALRDARSDTSTAASAATTTSMCSTEEEEQEEYEALARSIFSPSTVPLAYVHAEDPVAAADANTNARGTTPQDMHEQLMLQQKTIEGLCAKNRHLVAELASAYKHIAKLYAQ